MSYFNRVMVQPGKINSDTTCPVCGKKSKHSLSKVSRDQTLLCPHCKSLFIAHH
ncbi:YnfU family zinc-binding protein [Erwinia tasmaniensis]|uniref:YnfU family zinc-binding protein n=1 Tax=Erwinia tasmaniensis TaxID=338565 RepID=UPI003A4D46F8